MSEYTKDKAYEADRRINQIAADLSYPEPPQVQHQLTAIRAKIAEAEQASAKPVFALWRYTFVAAMGMIALFFWVWIQPETISSKPGERLTRKLDDGSEIHLRPGSQVQLANGFNQDNRDLSLEGEAYFSVEKGQLPFRISVNQTLVTVLGTRFNVRARGDAVRVEVSEGQVLFSDSDGEQKTLLQAGQRATYQDGSFSSPYSFPSWDEPAWMNNTFVFQQETLAAVCADIERQFNTQIQVAPELADKPISGRLKAEDAESLMVPLCALVNATWRSDQNGFIIEPK